LGRFLGSSWFCQSDIVSSRLVVEPVEAHQQITQTVGLLMCQDSMGKKEGYNNATTTQSSCFEKRNDFLKSVLLHVERRRDAVEHKASIFLAANALLLTAIRGLGSPIPTSLASSRWIWLGIGLLILFLLGIATSSFCAVQVLAPFGYQKRKRVMKVSNDEFNVYWLGKISQFTDSRAYSNALEPLTEQQLLEQLTNEAYNLSCLVTERYQWIHRAQRAVLLSIFSLLGLAALLGLAVKSENARFCIFQFCRI
jgi:Family of unknown function (DUF5706)